MTGAYLSHFGLLGGAVLERGRWRSWATTPRRSCAEDSAAGTVTFHPAYLELPCLGRPAACGRAIYSLTLDPA